MHHITEYLTQSRNSMASIFTANPFGFLMKVGESDEVVSRQSTDSGSMDRKTISDLQVRMMMWEFEAYLNGYHKKDRSKTSMSSSSDSSVDSDFADGIKPSQFKPFISIVNSQKSNTFLKDHPEKRLKLEQLCGELHYNNSKKVMTEFRDSVLRANPPMKSKKMVELFEIILMEALEGQREAEAAWRADPENLNKLSTKYIGNKISRAMESVCSIFTHTSNKIMPVVDFLLGTEDDDDGTGAQDDDTQAESTFNAADSERPRDHERVIKRGARELERRRGDQNHPPCTVRVNDETEIEAVGEALSDGLPSISPRSKECHHPIKSGLSQQVNRNTNNCTDTRWEMNTFGNDVILEQGDRTNLIDREVKFRCKPGKIKRKIEEGVV